MEPQEGEIWQYRFYHEDRISTVVVLKRIKDWDTLWTCLCIDNGEIGEWVFNRPTTQWTRLA